MAARKIEEFDHIKEWERREMLCFSSPPWLGYIHQGHFLLAPFSYAASFSSDQCAGGVVAVCGDALRIFTIER